MGLQTDAYLVNYDMYYIYGDFVRYPDREFIVNVKDIRLDNYYDHLSGIFSVILDGIDEPIITQKHIIVDFGEIRVPLSTVDYWYSIIMWYALLRTAIEIQPAHVFFDHQYLTQSTIKRFIDRFVIPVNRKRYSNRVLNNIINECLKSFAAVEEFSMYLMNTINLRDDIDLMNANKEYYDLLHADLSNVSLEDEKKVAMDITDRGIDIIKNSSLWLPYQHCLADSFKAKQGVNARQYKEFNYHIGTKPRDNGEVWTESINASFTNGGVQSAMYYTIESSAGRTAQMMSKINVGDSGSFARLLGLNNIDTFLHPDPHYDCNTKNYEHVYIANTDFLNLLIGRYYKTNPRGVDYVISSASTSLIGTWIYLRSPMTCASNARGEGICYKCYGDLAYTNRDINVGKMAADILSSKLTQRLLSAKHLLETIIVKIKWSEHFEDIFEIEGNAIKMQSDVNPKEWTIIIDPEDITLENELDFSGEYDDEDSNQGSIYNEYITKFIMENKRGERYEIHTEAEDKLYITDELNSAIRNKGKASEDKINIPMVALEDSYLFFVVIHNNELSKTMELLMDILNKNAETTSMDRHQILQKFLDTVIEGSLYITSVHCEVLLSNQIRSIDDVHSKPEWQYPDEPYNLLTLNSALNNNPSIIVSLMYQRLSKVLYNPLSFRKNGASFLDLFFMENPTEYLNKENVVAAKVISKDEKSLISPLIKITKTDDDDL